CPADGQHLLLPAREITGQTTGTLAEPWKIIEHHINVLTDVLLVFTRKRSQTKVFEHGHVLDDPAALHNLKNALVHNGLRGLIADRFALERDAATGDLAILGLEQARYGLECRRLACPV